MELQKILAACDHTLLRQDSTWKEIRAVLDDAIRFGCASACIPASFVKQAKNYVGDRLPICTVIGFPNGYSTTKTKVFETLDAVSNGADEIDMVVNVGWIKEKKFDETEKEIALIKEACGGNILKVILEICLLTDKEIEEACRCAVRAGADFVKTSTGFSKGGATFHAVELMKKTVGDAAQVKAAGGISSLADAEQFLALGASRLGTSRIVKIAKETQNA